MSLVFAVIFTGLVLLAVRGWRLAGDPGVAGDLIAEVGGLKLFALIGFYQAGDERLARAPGRLSGVIGAASAPLDV